MATDDVHDLWQRARAGDEGAVGRVLSLVEVEGPERDVLLELANPHTGQAHRVGFAGPPGAGKSTLISKLAHRFVAASRKVGVIAVDPTSPRTGGALLGDRVRMSDLEHHDEVFIRSLASRGHPGGLSLATGLVADVLDALGYDPVLLETVGVGQGELDVMRKVHTVVLLLLPGSGDAIQLMKAGLLEVADILVVNKGDRDGADELFLMVQSEVEGRPRVEGQWVPPVLRATAYRGEGIDEVFEAIGSHVAHLRSTHGFEERRRTAISIQLRQLVERALLQRIWKDEAFSAVLENAATDIARHETDLAKAAHDLAARLKLPSLDRDESRGPS